jgi:hypothetical protein
MKARIRKTGEIVDIICYGGSPNRRSDILDYVNYIDSKGIEHTEPNNLNYYWDFEPIETAIDEHWQDVRERAAIVAMQGIMNFFGSLDYNRETIAKLAVEQADAIVEQLKSNQ